MIRNHPRQEGAQRWIVVAFAAISLVLGLLPASSASASVTVLSSGATAIGAGAEASCAILAGGSVECWGSNHSGELGNGTTSSTWSSTPVPVSGLTGVAAIDVGDTSCAVTTGGAARCWGPGDEGQLGDGMLESSSVPVAVFGIGEATAISSGGYSIPGEHNCALLSGGTVVCWGSDSEGQLGDLPAQSSSTPVAVSGLTGATAISAGGNFTCALLSGGTVDCWGRGSDGELGDGTGVGSDIPVPVSGIGDATAITAGDGHACALLSNGTVKCWGRNGFGQLGDDQASGTESDIPVQVSGLGGVVAISAGYDYTCALLAGGSLECWGEDSSGQLGIDAGPYRSTPVLVPGLGGVTAISAGSTHFCVLLSGGAVECWGGYFGPLESSTNGGATNGAGVPASEPQVTITSHPPRETSDQKAQFEFTGAPGGSYECRIDTGSWRPCRSSDSFGPLQPGDHRFEVRETVGGLTGPSDSYSWTIDLPKACILKVARARVFAFTHQEKARLVIHYKAYEPAQVSVSYSLAGSKGSFRLGTASAQFKTAGVFRLGEKLDKSAVAKLRATSSMKVHFSIPQAPSSCTSYYTKRLTIPKQVFGQTVWFQSDSIFGGGA